MPLRFGLLAFPDVQQLDLTGPYEVFASAKGTEVHLVWKNTDPILSSTGLLLQPTTSFADCPPLDVLRSEEHTSELQSLMRISYAVFCLKKKKDKHKTQYNTQSIPQILPTRYKYLI